MPMSKDNTTHNAEDIILEIKNLRTHFTLDTGTIRAVDGVDLTISRGKTVGVIGESGCGKSVTAHSILRLIPSPPRRDCRWRNLAVPRWRSYGYYQAQTDGRGDAEYSG